MAMNIGSGGGGGRRRGRSALAAEINVTPFVDVMLVLLIVFMITAPLLQKGVDVNLPNSAAKQLPATVGQPLQITIQASGKVFIQQTEIERDELITQINAISDEGYEEAIHLKIDKQVEYADMFDVMVRIQQGGYSNLKLVGDPRARAPRNR